MAPRSILTTLLTDHLDSCVPDVRKLGERLVTATIDLHSMVWYCRPMQGNMQTRSTTYTRPGCNCVFALSGQVSVPVQPSRAHSYRAGAAPHEPCPYD